VEGRTDSVVAVALGRALAPPAAAAAAVPPAGCPEHTGPLEDQTAAWDSWPAEVLAVEAVTKVAVVVVAAVSAAVVVVETSTTPPLVEARERAAAVRAS
jgi:hypothetical protein